MSNKLSKEEEKELDRFWGVSPAEIDLRYVVAQIAQSREQAGYERGIKHFLKNIKKIDRPTTREKKVAYVIADEVGYVDWGKLEKYFNEKNNE